MELWQQKITVSHLKRRLNASTFPFQTNVLSNSFGVVLLSFIIVYYRSVVYYLNEMFDLLNIITKWPHFLSFEWCFFIRNSGNCPMCSITHIAIRPNKSLFVRTCTDYRCSQIQKKERVKFKKKPIDQLKYFRKNIITCFYFSIAYLAKLYIYIFSNRL